MVADAFEKIRVNPGNFADGRKTFEVINYDDPAQFAAEREAIRCVREAKASRLRRGEGGVVHGGGVETPARRSGRGGSLGGVRGLQRRWYKLGRW